MISRKRLFTNWRVELNYVTATACNQGFLGREGLSACVKKTYNGGIYLGCTMHSVVLVILWE